MREPSNEQPSFHEGEQAMQERAGIAARMREVGPRAIRDFMPDQHRELFEELPMLFVGSLDAQGRPWASVMTGAPGFVASPDPYTLRIHIDRGLHRADPLRERLMTGAPLGLLGLQLETRRRNRMNGRITQLNDALLEVHVAQSFGNCPKYIHARSTRFRGSPSPVSWSQLTREGAVLSAAALALIERADTFFLASASARAPGPDAAQGVDISHRGGPAGFVTSEPTQAGTLLTAPDYVGNFFFNTLGNLSVYPHAGLLFIDFSSGDLLSLTADATIVHDGEQLSRFQGAQRLTRFLVHEGFLARGAVALRER